MYKRIFIDTNPFIYLLEGIAPYDIVVRDFLFEEMCAKAEFCTSTITDAEFLAKPIADGTFDKVMLYSTFLKQFSIAKSSIDEYIAERSAHIRAKYKGIKLADALQLASAIVSGCDVFLTNDKQLRQVEEIQVVLLDDL